jgi:hypothetical protein
MHVYIDNSALKAIHYNLSHPSIRTLAEAASNQNIVILTNSILEGEFLKHCEEMLNNEKVDLRKINCLRYGLTLNIDNLIVEADKINARTVLQNYLSLLHCQNINKEVDWKIVFSKYYRGDPPFSKNKKNEFSDAFVIEMLLPFLKKNLVIVAGDNDFYEWAKGENDVTNFRSINAYVDHYIRSRNDAITKFFINKQKEVEVKVKEYFTEKFSDDCYYEITSNYYSDIEFANVKNIQDVDIEILSIDTESNELEVKCMAKGKVDLDINAAVVVYDSIDKEDIHLGSNSRTAEIEAEFKCTARVNVDIKNNLVEILELYDEDVIANDFEIPHEWETFLDE